MRATRGSEAGVLASGWPRTTIICVVGLISSFLSALLLALIKGLLDPLKILTIGFIGIWLPAIIFSMLQSLTIGGNVMNLRRSMTNVSVLINFILLASIVGLIAHVLGADITIEEVILMGTALAASFNALIYRYMTGNSLAISGATSIIWPILALVASALALNGSISNINYFKILLVIIIMAIPAIIISKGIDRLSEKLVGMSAKKVFRAYITNWLTGAKEDLESVFNHVGVDSEVICNLLCISAPQGSLIGVIAVPYVHPGPLKNIGSSSLPPDLIFTIESICKTKALSFHGFTTHASDITSSRDYQLFLDQIARELSQPLSPPLNGPSSRLVRINVNGLSVGCHLIKGLPLVFVSADKVGVEDISERLRIEVEGEIEKAYGVKPILINAHNSYEEEPRMDLEKLKKGIIDVIGLAFKNSSYDPIKIGIGRVKPAHYGKSYGLGDAGIGALIIEFKGLKYCYLMIDANNAEKKFRSTITSMVKSLGYNDCELFTTDNHSIVHLKGVKAKRGYYILGEKIKAEELSNTVKRTLEEAEASLQDANVIYKTVKVKAHVLGDIGHKSIENLMDQAVQKFRSLGLTTYGLALITSLLLCALA